MDAHETKRGCHGRVSRRDCRRLPEVSDLQRVPGQAIIGDYNARPRRDPAVTRSEEARRRRKSGSAMAYRWLAEATVALHLAFIVFVLFGGCWSSAT